MQSTLSSSSSSPSSTNNNNRVQSTILLILFFASGLFYTGNVMLQNYNNKILSSMGLEQTQKDDGYLNQAMTYYNNTNGTVISSRSINEVNQNSNTQQQQQQQQQQGERESHNKMTNSQYSNSMIFAQSNNNDDDTTVMSKKLQLVLPNNSDSKATLQTAVKTTIISAVDKSEEETHHPHDKLFFSCTLSDGNNITLPVSVPHFIIIGAQKGGTTALYQILSQLPNMIASKKVEAHFFDMYSGIKRNYDGLATATPNQICESRKRYAELWPTTIPPSASLASNSTSIIFAKNNNDDTTARNSKNSMHKFFQDPSKYLTFEKTPSYCVVPNVPQFIVEFLYPHKPKIIMVLRNPIDRAFSLYKMDKTSGNPKIVNKSFEDMIEQEIAKWRKFGLLQMSHALPTNWANDNVNVFSFPEMSIPKKLTLKQQTDNKVRNGCFRRGTYVYQIQNWLQHFELHTELMVVNYEHYRQNQTKVLSEMLQFLGIKDNIQDLISLDRLNRDYSPRQSSRWHHQSKNEIVLKNSTRLFLQKLYKPYNDLLADLLGEEWRGVWD